MLFKNKCYPEALKCFVQAFSTLEGIGALPDAQTVANLLVQFRQALGAEKFDALWSQEINQPMPDWLKQQPQEEQGMSVEQFIAAAIQSAREKRPEAEEYFKAAQKMASDPTVPQELKELGKVLQRVMAGSKNMGLSNLPAEWAALIQRMKAEG